MTREELQQLVQESKSPAQTIAENIIAHAQKVAGPENEAVLATLIGERVLQNLQVTCMLSKYPPGDSRGEVEFRNFYEAFKRGVIDRWNSEDLKAYFGRPDEGNPPSDPTH